ncbi:MAG: BMP family ABC transporter substrate-binding protein [Candidatus Limnocylindrales bacterium]
MKKRHVGLSILLLFVAVTPAMARDDGVFRVAAVAPSAINDLAFSQSMYDALVSVQEELGADKFQFDFLGDTSVVDDAAVALREWASSGDYALLIAHGSQYETIVEELAADFPEVSFARENYVDTIRLDNVFDYSASAGEGGYVNGVLAANLSDSGVIGVIGPFEVGDAKPYVDGFVRGVASVDQAITVNVVYIQSFSDVPLAAEVARDQITDDADVLTGTAQMVVGPIEVAVEDDVLWFGTQSSQASISEDVGVAFQVYKWDVLLKDMIAEIQAGVPGGEAYTLTLANKGLVMEVHERTDVDEDGMAVEGQLQSLADEIIAGIVDGSIQPLPEEMVEAEGK